MLEYDIFDEYHFPIRRYNRAARDVPPGALREVGEDRPGLSFTAAAEARPDIRPLQADRRLFGASPCYLYLFES